MGNSSQVMKEAENTAERRCPFWYLLGINLFFCTISRNFNFFKIVISERVSSLIRVSTDRVPRGGGARASKMGEEVKIQVYKEDSK